MRRLTLILYSVLITVITFSAIYYSVKKQPILVEKDSNSVEMFEIYANPYDVTINVIITRDTLKALTFVQQNTDSTMTIKDFRDAVGITFSKDASVTLWFPEMSRSTTDITIANHELFHAMFYILDRAGVVLSSETNEVYAYELDYLSQQFYKHIK